MIKVKFKLKIDKYGWSQGLLSITALMILKKFLHLFLFINADDAHYLRLMAFSKRVAKALKKVVPCERIGVAVVGLEVPHTHVHLIPISEMKEMTFQHKVKLTDEEFKALAQKVSEAL